ncbi:MAG: DUF378 domain-containing protein [Candidatus Doudnabacteria bacterium]|nr:DUF378 domain-containing protein [Candidatus Doudnabacteria bacterium]
MMTKGHRGFHLVTVVLMWIGGLNWLVYALVGSELGQWIFGSMTASGSKVVYILVGLATVYEILMHGKHCRMCKPEGMSQQM